MAIPGSGQVSIKDILDEKQDATTARTNVSLKGLSVDGVNDYQNADITGSPNQAAPYGIAEFHGYSHVWSTTFSGSTTNSGGKADITRHRTSLTDNTVDLVSGTWTIQLESYRGHEYGVRIGWGSSSVATDWTSMTVQQSSGTGLVSNPWTLNRSAMSTENVDGQYWHYFNPGTGHLYLLGSGTGTLTINV
jgi:hypothetical protein